MVPNSKAITFLVKLKVISDIFVEISELLLPHLPDCEIPHLSTHHKRHKLLDTTKNHSLDPQICNSNPPICIAVPPICNSAPQICSVIPTAT